MESENDYVTLAEIGVWKSSKEYPNEEEWDENGGMFPTRTKRKDGSYIKYVRYWDNDSEYWMLPSAQHNGSWRPNNGFTEWLSPFVG